MISAPQLDVQNPWPGLLPFSEASERYFHGREAEAEHLLRLVQRQTLTVLFGKSGLGKTSLLLAGLFPRLRAEHFLPIYIRLELQDGASDPQHQVWAALADNIQWHRIDGRDRNEGETLWEYFHVHDADFWDRRNRLVTPCWCSTRSRSYSLSQTPRVFSRCSIPSAIWSRTVCRIASGMPWTRIQSEHRCLIMDAKPAKFC